MRIDLLPYHIKVSAVHPGAAETDFSIVRFKGAEETAKKMYAGYEPLQAGDVADIIYYIASLPHTRLHQRPGGHLYPAGQLLHDGQVG